MSNNDQNTDPKPLHQLVDLCESTGVEKAYVDVESLRRLLDERDRYREALEEAAEDAAHNVNPLEIKSKIEDVLEDDDE